MYNLFFYFSAGGGGGGRSSNPKSTGGIGIIKGGEKWFVYCCENKITITQNPNLECELLTEPFDSEEEAIDWANKNFPSGKC